MVNYENGKIYELIDNINGNRIIGKTSKEYLSQVVRGYNHSYRQYLKDKKKTYLKVFDIIKNGNYKIVLLESCQCENIDELNQKFNEWSEKIVPLNKPIVKKEKSSKHNPRWRNITLPDPEMVIDFNTI
jgi:hypothetical protein